MTTDNQIRLVFDKMLEHHGVSYDHVIANPVIDGINWYEYYTMTTEQENEFREWFMRFMKLCGYNKRVAEREYAVFNLCFGLKIEQ